MRFDGKVAFVTGGASGLGAAAAGRFASEGARVVVADIDEQGARQIANQLPDALAVSVDTAGMAASFSCARQSSWRSAPLETIISSGSTRLRPFALAR